eukprot:m.65724 g.65724  ORF g.65724 m.65724 type:complete len:617 (-) comp13555_c1_seq1:30-1880(-)
MTAEKQNRHIDSQAKGKTYRPPSKKGGKFKSNVNGNRKAADQTQGGSEQKRAGRAGRINRMNRGQGKGNGNTFMRKQQRKGKKPLKKKSKGDDAVPLDGLSNFAKLMQKKAAATTAKIAEKHDGDEQPHKNWKAIRAAKKAAAASASISTTSTPDTPTTVVTSSSSGKHQQSKPATLQPEHQQAQPQRKAAPAIARSKKHESNRLALTKPHSAKEPVQQPAPAKKELSILERVLEKAKQPAAAWFNKEEEEDEDNEEVEAGDAPHQETGVVATKAEKRKVTPGAGKRSAAEANATKKDSEVSPQGHEDHTNAPGENEDDLADYEETMYHAETMPGFVLSRRGLPTKKAKVTTPATITTATATATLAVSSTSDSITTKVLTTATTVTQTPLLAAEGLASKAIRQALAMAIALQHTTTLTAPVQLQGRLSKFIALDCEMVGVGRDGHHSALARCSLVNKHGEVILDTYVKPREKVVDYRTHVSGILPHHLEKAPSFDTVQKQVAEVLKNRILVGHAIHHDLKALMLWHPRRSIRDTATFGPYRRLASTTRPALRVLAKAVLGLNMHQGQHDSVIDARAALFLYLHARKEWETTLHSKKTDDTKLEADADVEEKPTPQE